MPAWIRPQARLQGDSEDPGAEPELATVEGTFDAITAMRL